MPEVVLEKHDFPSWVDEQTQKDISESNKTKDKEVVSSQSKIKDSDFTLLSVKDMKKRFSSGADIPEVNSINTAKDKQPKLEKAPSMPIEKPVPE